MTHKPSTRVELQYYLARYSALVTEEETARKDGNDDRVSDLNKARDYIEQVLIEDGFIPVFHEGQGIWTLALRDQVNPE